MHFAVHCQNHGPTPMGCHNSETTPRVKFNFNYNIFFCCDFSKIDFVKHFLFFIHFFYTQFVYVMACMYIRIYILILTYVYVYILINRSQTKMLGSCCLCIDWAAVCCYHKAATDCFLYSYLLRNTLHECSNLFICLILPSSQSQLQSQSQSSHFQFFACKLEKFKRTQHQRQQKDPKAVS